MISSSSLTTVTSSSPSAIVPTRLVGCALGKRPQGHGLGLAQPRVYQLQARWAHLQRFFSGSARNRRIHGLSHAWPLFGCKSAKPASSDHRIIGAEIGATTTAAAAHQVMIEYYCGPCPEPELAVAAGAGSSTPNSVPMANLAIGA